MILFIKMFCKYVCMIYFMLSIVAIYSFNENEFINNNIQKYLIFEYFTYVIQTGIMLNNYKYEHIFIFIMTIINIIVGYVLLGDPFTITCNDNICVTALFLHTFATIIGTLMMIIVTIIIFFLMKMLILMSQINKNKFHIQ